MTTLHFRTRLEGAARTPTLVPTLATALVLVLAMLAFENYEVVSKVPLQGSPQPLYTIRLFDTVDVKVLPERRLSLDLFNAYLLMFTSAVGLMAAMLLTAAGRAWRDRLVICFALTGVGLLYLGVDELVGIHESVGRNLLFLADIPGVRHADDVLLPIYALVGGLFVYGFRRELAVGGAKRLFIAAVGVFALAAAGDVLDVGQLEETLEVVAAMLGVAAFVTLALHHVVAALSVAADRPTA